MNSIDVLNLLDQKTEFMDSLSVVADMGCGKGQDSFWWSTRKDVDDKPRNLFVFSVDRLLQIDNHYRHKNLRFVKEDYSNTTIAKNRVDTVWAYNSFQFSTNPVKTLRHWWDIMNTNGLLSISIPQTNYIDDLSRWQMTNPSGVLWPHNMCSLIYLLAACGFDCAEGHFRQKRHEDMIHLMAYKSEFRPMDLEDASLYLLDEMKLLPPSASACVKKFGMLRHEFLHLEWLDGTICDLAIESIP